MSYQPRPPSFLLRIIPYLVFGIVLVFIFIAFVFLSSILLIGSIIGLIIFGVAYVKARFFGKKSQNITLYQTRQSQEQKPEGKVYEHEDSDSKK